MNNTTQHNNRTIYLEMFKQTVFTSCNFMAFIYKITSPTPKVHIHTPLNPLHRCFAQHRSAIHCPFHST